MRSSAVKYQDVTTWTTGELLALALRERSGVPNETSVGLERGFDTLHGLFDATMEELAQATGVNLSKALRIKAVLELAKRYATQSARKLVCVNSPADVAKLLGPQMRSLSQEQFCVLLLDTKNQVLQSVTVSVGTLNATLVHPREVFRLAIKRASAAVILAHSHPSGVPTPSPEDLSLTRRLVDAGKLLGIEVLDHVVIGDGRHVSLREQGMMS